MSEQRDRYAEQAVDALVKDLQELVGISDLLPPQDVRELKDRWIEILGPPTSSARLAPFVERSNLVVIVEPDGTGGAAVFRPGLDEDVFEQVPHSFDISYAGEPDARYISRVSIKIDRAPGS